MSGLQNGFGLPEFGGWGLAFACGTDLPDGGASYSFTVSGGAVTAMERVDGNHTVTLPLTSAESFTVGTGTVTETIAGSSATESITYRLETGSSSLYQITSETQTVTSPTTTLADGGTLAYGFTVSGGSVTAETITLSHGSHTLTTTITPPSDAAFTIGSASISESWAQGNEVVTVTYVQPSGDTGYAVASEQTTLITEGTATTQLSIDTGDRASFTISSSGAVTGVSAIGYDGTSRALTIPSNVAFTELATGFVEETITHGSNSRYVIFYDASGGGTYTEVAHGSGTVDLTGLKTQLAELPSAVQALL
jgi:hypothetical protein